MRPGEWVVVGAVLLAGVVVFGPLGFAIAYLARPRAAAVIANVVFLPLAFASGFFVPLSELPALMQDVARFLPTYHFGQLARGAMAPAADLEAYGGEVAGDTALHLAVVLGWGAVCVAATVWGYRRESARERS